MEANSSKVLEQMLDALQQNIILKKPCYFNDIENPGRISIERQQLPLAATKLERPKMGNRNRQPDSTEFHNARNTPTVPTISENSKPGNRNSVPECLQLRNARLRSNYPAEGSTGKTPRLTFGVEIEIAIATLRETCVDPNPLDPRVAYGIAWPRDGPSLTVDPRPAEFGKNTDEEKQYRKERLHYLYEHITTLLRDAGLRAKHENSAVPPWGTGEGDWVTDHWVIGTDATIRCASETFYDFCQIEIKSPVFYYSEAALEEVEKVCDLIARTYRVLINESMGLHVHVGNGILGFDSITLRNLFGILWTTEKWLETIHPLHRTRGNEHCEGFRKCSYFPFMSNQWEEMGTKTLEYILGDEMPMRVRKILDLIRKHSGAYNMINLYSEFNTDNFKRTIEFRQHEGTIDSERIVEWVRLCVGLIQISAATEREILDACLWKLIRMERESVGLGDVLDELGLKTSATYYRDHVPKPKVAMGTAIKNWTKNKVSRESLSKVEEVIAMTLLKSMGL